MENNIEVIERLFRLRGRLQRFAGLYVSVPSDVEDIVMDAYAYLWECRDSLDMTGNLESWMFTVVKHKCLNYLKHQRIRREAEAQISDEALWELDMSIATLSAFDPEWLYSTDVKAHIDKALTQLSQKTRQIFEMSRYEQKTYSEIAQAMELSVKTVEFHMSKALKILRCNLDKL